MGALSFQDYDELITLIYRAGADPAGWHDVLTGLNHVLGGASMVLYGHDTYLGCSLGALATGFSEQGLASYHDHFHKVNPFPPVFMNHTPGSIAAVYQILDRQNFLRGEFYNDFLRKEGGLGGGGGGPIINEAGKILVIAAHVSLREEETKTPLLIDVLKILCPHMKHAFDMQRRLQGQKVTDSAYRAALDSVANSTIVLDRTGRVVFANRAARKSMSASGCLRLSPGGMVGFRDKAAQAAFGKALTDLSGRDRAWVPACFSVEIADNRKTVATLDRFSIADENAGVFSCLAPPRPGAPVALLTICDAPLEEATLARRLGHLYDLTRAEQVLATGILRGEALETIARKRQVSVNTLRNQLRSVFAKTGCQRQSQLVSKLSLLR